MSILVATNFSPAATEAARIAAHFASAVHEPLKVVHVVDFGESAESARSRVAKARAALVTICPDIETDVLTGAVDETLAYEVEAHSPRLVVVGSASGANGHVSAHDIAEQLAQDLSCAVLVVRPASSGLKFALSNHRRLRVFVALDRTDTRAPVIAWLRWLRKHLPCDILAAQFYWPAAEHERLGIVSNSASPSANPEVKKILDTELLGDFDGLDGAGELLVQSQPRTTATSIDVVNAAQAANADVVVVGSHRRFGVSRFIHGSVSRDVLRHSDIPVICVGIPATSRHHNRPIQKVLVATDFSDCGNVGVPRAYDLLKDARGSVYIIHVVSKALDAQDAEVSALTDRLRALVPEAISTDDITTTIEILDSASVDTAIIQASERWDVDILVIGTRGRGRVERTLMGSVATEVVRRANRPVLVCPNRVGTP